MSDRFPLSTLWIAALLCGLFFINEWQLQLFAASFILLCLFVCLQFSKDVTHGWSIPKSSVLTCFGLLWALTFFSIFWSSVPFVSVIGFCLVSILPLTFFTFVLAARDQDYKIVQTFISVILGGLAVWALVQFYGFQDVFGRRAHHPFANANSLAAILNLGLFPALGVMVTTDNKKYANAALAFAILMFVGICAASSRGALLSAAIALIGFLICNPSALKAHWKCFTIFAIGGALSIAATSLSDFNSDNMAWRLAALGSDQFVTEIANNRENIWAGALGIIKEHVWLGTGIGTFFLYYPSFRIPEEIRGVYMAHSDPLQFWAELGVLGPILFYALGIAIFIRTLRAVSKIEKGSPKRTQIWAVFFAIFALILHTHFTFNLYIVSILFVLGFLLAWWFRETGSVLNDTMHNIKFPEKFPHQYRSAFIVLPMVMLAGLFSSFMASEYFSQKAEKVLLTQNLEKFLGYVQLSDEISMHTNFRPYMQAVTVPISMLEINSAQMSLEDEKDIVNRAWNYLDHSERLNPQNSAISYYRGVILKHATPSLVPEGALSQEEYYKQALAINPLHVAARTALMDMYSAKKDQDQFINIMEQGLNWVYRTPAARDFYLRAQRYYIFKGDVAKFEEVKAKLTDLDKRLKKGAEDSARSLPQKMFGQE